MAEPTLLEQLPDDIRVAVMLRADGWSYDEIADFMNVNSRRVRFLLEQSTKMLPGILDYRRDGNSGRLMRLVYLTGYIDGKGCGQSREELYDALDMLIERTHWLMIRMDKRREMKRSLKESV